MGENRTPTFVIVGFVILVIVALLFNSSRGNEDMREKYYKEGYKAAKEDVEDWFDYKFDYYNEIYQIAYKDGYNHGYDDGSEKAFWIGYEEGLNGVEY